MILEVNPPQPPYKYSSGYLCDHSLVQVCPAFQKFVLFHFTFMKDLHQYLCLLTKRNLKRNFAFMTKGKKQM